MSNVSTSNSSRQSMIPRGGPALIGVIMIAFVAFVLGALFFGGGSTPSEDSHDHATEATSGSSVWTCSMHPQIQLPKPGKCPICFMDLIPLESGSGEEIDPGQLRMSETAMQLAGIETTPVRRAFADREVRMVGKVAFDETRVANITAWVPGRLDRLFADYTGITVSKGDHMVDMYSPELLAAQQELLQARQAVRSLSNSPSRVLESTAKATLDAVREKLRLSGLSDAQVAEIEMSDGASDHLTIYAPIGGVVVHKDAQEGMYVETGTRLYSIADLSQLWVLFEAYESDLPWIRYGQKVQFTSPSFPGEIFRAIVSFIDPMVDPKTRTVHVRAIADNEHQKLKPDMFITGRVSSRVDSNGDVIDEDLAGKWISPMHPEIVKAGPGTCDVCGMALVPAESLGYALRTLTDADAPLLIPTTAPLITGKRAVVYIELPNDDGPLFEGREIKLGPRAGEFYVVKAGLQEGDLVVTNGAFRIDSELQIRAKPSMMSPQAGVSTTGHLHGRSEAGTESTAAEPPITAMTNLAESEDVVKSLTPVYEAYFATQMALANDDHDRAVEAALELERATSAVDMGKFSSAGHERWMLIQKSLITAVKALAGSRDIKEARDGFYHLSKAAIDLHDSFGHAPGRDFYLTFCPMARNNAGAYWLQTENIVWNSFYGEAMLRCGEIKKPLPAIDGMAE
ncbi:MAG: efflux RND transporter periplasmic adaptor subunit [bacterium]